MRLASLAHDALPFVEDWGKLTPHSIRPAAGKLRLAALSSLMYQYNLGGPIWLRQFIFGFKLVGVLSQMHTFPAQEKLAGKRPLKQKKDWTIL